MDIWCVFTDDAAGYALYGPVHIFVNVDVGDAVVCRSPNTQVWTGHEWVPCEGPNAPMTYRCTSCDYRSLA